MPLPLLTSAPPATEAVPVIAALSRSVSLASSCACVMMIGVPSTAVNVSATATGAPSLTAVTLIVAVAGVASVRPPLSRAAYWKLVLPFQSG